MKVFLFDDVKLFKRCIIIMFALFVFGVVVGSIYLCAIPNDDRGVFYYLESYLECINSGGLKKEIFTNSIINYIKIFIIVTVCSFIKFGLIPISAVSVVNGFCTGFTVSSFFMFYKLNGIRAVLAMLPALIIYICCLVFFCARAVLFNYTKKNTTKRKIFSYLILSICYLTIFCITAFFDGFITTTFMKLFF